MNKVINAVGKFIGLESEVNLHLNTVDFSKFSNKLSSGVEKTFDKAGAFTRDFTAENIKKMGAQMLGYKGNSGFTSSLQDGGAASAAAKMSMQDIDSIGKIGEVGKIKDSVDISVEDLKMMRELAKEKVTLYEAVTAAFYLIDDMGLFEKNFWIDLPNHVLDEPDILNRKLKDMMKRKGMYWK
ncbi:hypothetical protein [Paenibacillus apis]|uniref:Uncharacterized protein n=1 Tax=Paenibacillus apis TaxID=1792174 RepID=A0A920CNG3_9BACL|nr:hypothetical protein [Paenibacillus apis]GIO43167.1 hypothetical protein J41TS4_29250 [Paenibacillus apis]